jgi:colicin import membrane protein
MNITVDRTAWLLALTLLAARCAAPQPESKPMPITTLDAWAHALVAKISRSWERPADFVQGMSCEVIVKIDAQGVVQNARLPKTCGSEAIDQAVITGAYRASPLPIPDDPAIFDPTLVLRFTPK